MLFREWFIVCLMFCFVGSLFFARQFPSKVPCFIDSSVLSSTKIQVEVIGEVERPGVYEIEVGTSLGSVLKSVGLKKTASSKGLYLKKKLLNSCLIMVPKKKGEKEGKKKKTFSKMSSEEKF